VKKRSDYFRFKCKKLVELANLKRKKVELSRQKKEALSDERSVVKYYERIHRIVEREFWKNTAKVRA
jgi:hypothetical protein